MRVPRIQGCLVLFVAALCLHGSPAAGDDASAELNALRYDGKPFEYWRDYLRTELKAERRIEAVRALAAFGARGHARGAGTAIADMVKDYGKDAYDGNEGHLTPDQKVIAEAVTALGKIGPAGYEVVLRQAKNANVRRFAEEVYNHHFADKRIYVLSESAVRTLLADVQGEDREVAVFATELLGQSIIEYPPSRENARAVLQAAKDSEALVRALIKLRESGPLDRIDHILKILGPRAKGAASTLIKVRLRGYFIAEGTFKALGIEGKELVPAIAEGLNSSDAKVRERAAKWLGKIGPLARPAAAALLRALREGPTAAYGMKRTRRGTAVVGGYSEEEAEQARSIVEARCAMIDALLLIRAEPRTVAPILAEEVSSGKITTASQLKAAQALGKLGARAKEVSPALLKVFASDQEDREVRSAALAALEQMGVDSRKLTPVLIEEIEGYLEDHPKNNWLDDEFTSQMLTSLVQLRPQAREALPLLLLAFKQFDHDNHHRPLLAQALGEMGPAAREALPDLRKAAKSDNVELRKAARAAIAKIEGDDNPPGPKSK